MKNNPKLSIIILNYNTRTLLKNCLDSLKGLVKEVDFETMVVDNGSTDESARMLKQEYPEIKVVENGSNLGFAKGNNSARNFVNGEYILFLNSDTIVMSGAIRETIKFLEDTPKAGAVTCKILLPNGKLDKDARRSFPTPWASLTHFSGVDRIFPRSKFLSGYWYGGYSEDNVMEIDVLQGAFFLTRKKILDDVGWFDEDYFLDGEDIDLCWKIKNAGWKIFYYPKVSIEHIKGATKGKVKSFGKVTKVERTRFVNAGVDSMAIFYKKRLWKKYPLALNLLVMLGITLLKCLRWFIALLS